MALRLTFYGVLLVIKAFDEEEHLTPWRECPRFRRESLRVLDEIECIEDKALTERMPKP